MRYKYFTWEEDGYMRGQSLLDEQQIATLLHHHSEHVESYATIQDYTKDGDVIGCPMFFDIDSPSLLDAYEEMNTLADNLYHEYGLNPLVYFSGSKGFHLIMPLYIRHQRCHEIMSILAKEMGGEVDTSVYRARSMWRCNNTYNPKGKKHKRFIDRTWPLDGIVNGGLGLGDMILQNMDFNDLDITDYIPLLPDRSKIVHGATDGQAYLPPCMAHLWAMDTPPEGRAHQLAHLMSRYFFNAGLSKHEAIAMFKQHNFWSKIKDRDYSKVIESVYRTGKSSIGCKHSRDAELMQPHCNKICMFNEDIGINDILGGIHE